MIRARRTGGASATRRSPSKFSRVRGFWQRQAEDSVMMDDVELPELRTPGGALPDMDTAQDLKT
jgi:hypothetical protein